MKTKYKILIVLGLLFVGLQFVPYGEGRTNPAVIQEPPWDSERTRDLAVRACFDCHSNETRWPWFSRVAPISWLILDDVEDGRRHLNFSEWQRPQRRAYAAADEVEEGEMPLWQYELLHAEARLTDEDKAELIEGLRKTLGVYPPQKGSS